LHLYHTIMKLPILIKVLLLNVIFSISTIGQSDKQYRLELKNGSFLPERNITSGKISALNRKLKPLNKKSFVIIQFDKIPSESERKDLQNGGIELLDYIPNNAFTATVQGSLNELNLKRAGARSVVFPGPEQKLQASLANGIIPAHAKKVEGFIDIWISFPKSFTVEEVREALTADHYEILSETYKAYQVLEIRIPESSLRTVASLPFVQYVQAVPKEAKPFNNHSTVNGRANILNSSVYAGLGLRGEGVVVGVGDDANPLRHIDLSNRIINRNPAKGGVHGIHVMGTLGGAGIFKEKYAGYAPKARIISQQNSSILAYAPAYVQDFGMVITNNSYGNEPDDCSDFGGYDILSGILDQQAISMPSLQHVFAVGNSGNVVCNFPQGFGNVLSAYQSAKNVICVGSTDLVGLIDPTSSRGPVSDGRIKPEIMAQGTEVTSTFPVNDYRSGIGTSFAAPAVSGGLALLYQKYRALNGQQNPKNGLMKAILCNGGTDKGNAGPDYKYGFGWMNLLRSVKMLESGSYRIGNVANGGNNEYEVNVPDNTAQVKVMLYWNDPAPSILSAKTLVHDLDLEVVENTSMQVTLPKLLNPSPANVNDLAGTGADHINNMEQVVLDNPPTGTYKIHVQGTDIAQNPAQEYFVVYDIIPVSTTLTYPIGKEHFAPGEEIYVHWDAYGNNGSDFTVQYSVNDGLSWINVSENAVTGEHLKSWVIPDVPTDKAKIKVIQNATGIESVSQAFTILNVPQIQLSDVQCEGYIALQWQPVAGATDYEVMLLRGDEMVQAGITSANNFVISGLARDSLYWFSVRARLNGNPGPRADALSRTPDSGSCAGTISDNDLVLDAILSPVSSGREFTSRALTNQTPVSVRIKNLDDVASTGTVTLRYSINNSEKSVNVPLSIPPNGTVNYTFPDQENFSDFYTYTLKATVNKGSDPVSGNNSRSITLRQLHNSPVTLPFLDDMESAAEQSKTVSLIGLDNADRYDFTNTSSAGRIRTFVNTGLAYSGRKAFTLDTDKYFPDQNSNFLDATFNLTNYSLSDDIRLNFQYKNHGQKSHPDNKVWVRGNYTDAWLPAFDLYAFQNSASQAYKQSASIELGNILWSNGQNLSPETQIRWGQHGDMLTADFTRGAGYSFDNIQLKIESDDIQLVSINSISEASCGLSDQQPVTISVRNSSDHEITNVPVSYKLGNGQQINETIPVIAARATIQYTFLARLNLSAFGQYAIKVWTSLPSDTYPDNNTIDLAFYNNAVVSSFPYLENFESGSGNWHTTGTNNTWAYGAPASVKINRAASGTKAWKTNLTGNYKNQETSYLYSPCFDINGMSSPALSFSLALDIEFCNNEACDVAYMEYMVDGANWTRLGAKGQGTNWYTKDMDNGQAWSVQNYTRWHVSTIDLPVTNGSIRFRLVLNTDPGTTREGVAIDDIHIYDKKSAIYDESTTLSPVSQTPANASGWIDFKQNGKLIASINPNGQNMGNTDVQAFINTGNVRDNGSQYYLDRNVTIKPENVSLTEEATVRIYFLDTESDRLITATGCAACTNVTTAYGLGISKYTDADKSKEDGSIANNQTGVWSYISSANTVKVPYDKGYYAEIKVRNFSEFWLNNGGQADGGPLPVELLSFSVTKNLLTEASDQVIANWVTTSELNASRFDIERASGSEALKLNQFKKIGTVTAVGESSVTNVYNFTDTETGKMGEYYYRLKIIDRDETFQYSMIRSVRFDEFADWLAYPNPSRGIVQVQYQAGAGVPVGIKVFDLSGNLVYQKINIANGKRQLHAVDLSGSGFTAGLYVVELISGEQKKIFRIVKL